MRRDSRHILEVMDWIFGEGYCKESRWLPSFGLEGLTGWCVGTSCGAWETWEGNMFGVWTPPAAAEVQ